MKIASATENFAGFIGPPTMEAGNKSIKIQDPGNTVKFWGVIWLGKTCVVPKAVIDKIKAYHIPKEIQAFISLGNYRVLVNFHTPFSRMPLLIILPS